MRARIGSILLISGFLFLPLAAEAGLPRAAISIPTDQNLAAGIFPSRIALDPFPSAADAIVLGCQHTDYIEVRLILFPNSNTSYLSSPLTVPCN